MKGFARWTGCVVLGVACITALWNGVAVSQGSMTEAEATLADIQQTLGSVPTFFKLFPPDALPGAWRTMKDFQMGPTEIPGKYKELIGLGVSAQIPCHYCTYFHTEAAKLNGATDAEIREAIAMASLTRFFSTILNGTGQDVGEFMAELERGIAHMETVTDPPPMNSDVRDAAAAKREIRQIFGFVPGFLASIPESALPGAWMEMKTLEMNSGTAVPNKYKSLVGLAVASQIPCAYCVYADGRFAELAGATENEKAEAVAMAANTRHWSTFLNGVDLNEAQFRKETDAIVGFFRKQMAKK